MGISYGFVQSRFVTKRLATEVSLLLFGLDTRIDYVQIEHLRQAAQTSRLLTAYDDGKLVGIACLAPVITFTRRRGIIDHVVVDEYERCKGIGTGMMEELIKEARKLNLTRLDLTCRDGRNAAHKLYLKLGFKKRETNNFRLELA